MREDLERDVGRLCWLFPQLVPCVEYSSLLSQREVNVFNAFINGHVQDVLCDASLDVAAKRRVLHACVNGSSGLSMIRESDVAFVSSLLAAVRGDVSTLSPKERDLVDVLRANSDVKVLLEEVCVKAQSVVGTCPLVIAPLPVAARMVPLVSSFHRFQEYHKLLHESIHFVLTGNDVGFEDEDVQEGFVAFLHEQVSGKIVRYVHYVGEEGERYVRNAQKIGSVLSRYPRSAMIPLVKKLFRVQ